MSNPDTIGASRRSFLRHSVAVVGLASTSVALASCTSTEASTAAPSDVDLGFLTDMSAHHGQALVMCQRVLGREVGTPVTTAASEVLQNQAIELGTMRAWLSDWGASTAPPETVMAWMMNGDGMPLAMMPGLATDAELAELSALDGAAQGRRWLELMMAHHIGGVAMADAAAELSSTDKVIRLATTMSSVQTFEIAQYEHLLATDYA